MKKSINVLVLVITVVLAITLSTLTVFAANTPEKRLSRLLLGGEYPVTYGYRPNKIHAGVDFGGAGDGVTSVRSPVTGTIIANTDACGKVAIYDGTNTIILAHMKERTSLAVNKTIKAGDYVGKVSKVVGGGCIASGPHLHIEIRTGRNTTMALPTNNNTATTKNPATYLVGLTAIFMGHDLPNNDYFQTFYGSIGMNNNKSNFLVVHPKSEEKKAANWLPFLITSN
jgi:hypothetical protein